MTSIPSNISASFPPSRHGPPPAIVPVSTGGLFPRDYRHRLREKPEPFVEVTEFNSATVTYRGSSPLIGTALHYNHDIRPDLRSKLSLDDVGRYYEEDPETNRFLAPLLHTITPNQSRYEMDLNRPPDTTVYNTPELAWGQQVWREPLNQFEREFSLEKWYEFHTMMDCAVEDAISRYGFAVVFDFHSYNYQRNGPTDWRTDDKPVINVGTRHLQLDPFGRKLVDDFMADISQHTVEGEPCMVQENGVFYGGYLNRRLSHLFGSRVITLSVEYKKVYMDEATGKLNEPILDELQAQMRDAMCKMAGRIRAPLDPDGAVQVKSNFAV